MKSKVELKTLTKSGIMQEGDGVGGLDVGVEQTLRSMQFRLCSPQALRARTEEGEGHASSQPVDGIRVFDFALLRKKKG